MTNAVSGPASGDRESAEFALAPMSTPVRTLTILIFGVALVIVVSTLLGAVLLAIPAALMAVLFAWVWLRFRPRSFTVHEAGISIDWPLRHVDIPARDIREVRMADPDELKAEIGWGLRIGAGGLWGGFGRLWTKRRGLVHLYISRTDQYVWIERHRGQPWLITPERPEAFVSAARASARAA